VGPVGQGVSRGSRTLGRSRSQGGYRESGTPGTQTVHKFIIELR
jgi:hypothetical protein